MTVRELTEDLRSKNKENVKLLQAMRSVSENQLNWVPPDKGWTLGQCLDHLVKTDSTYLEKLETAEQKIASGDEPFRHSFMGKMMINMVGPTAPPTVPVPKPFLPDEGPHHPDVVRKLQDLLARELKLIERVAVWDLQKIKVTSPVSALIRLNFGDAMMMMAVHDTRHLLQAQRILERPEFPAKKR